jgi:hypothetical protein
MDGDSTVSNLSSRHKFNTLHDSIIAACRAEPCAAVPSFRQQGTHAHLIVGPKPAQRPMAHAANAMIR